MKRLGHSNVTVDGPQIFEVVETDTDIAAASLPRTKVFYELRECLAIEAVHGRTDVQTGILQLQIDNEHSDQQGAKVPVLLCGKKPHVRKVENLNDHEDGKGSKD